MVAIRSGICLGLLSILLVPASAFPASSLEKLAGLVERQADNEQDANSVCRKTLTTDLWKDGGYSKQMGKFLKDGPPNGGYPKDGPDKSPLDVILSYATEVDGYACDPLDATNTHCSSQDLGSPDNCQKSTDEKNYNDPAAVTMLKAIANFANFMLSASAEARNLGDDVAKKQGELQENFGLDPEAKPNLGALGIETGPLVMASGMVGAIPGIGGILGAPLGFLIGMNNPIENQAWEPKFDTFMQFQGFMSNVSMGIEQAFKQAADIAINHVPAIKGPDVEEWATKDKSSLPQILSDGHFADAKSQTLGDGQQAMKNVLYSSGINMIWNASEIMIVRMSKAAYPGLADDLCGPQDAKSNPFPADIKYCDDEGFMHVLQRWDGQTQDVPGFSRLPEYDLDLKTVMKNSWAWQKKNGFSHKMNADDAKAVFDYDNPADLDISTLQMWTLPVCDLDNAHAKKEINEDTSYVDCTKRDDEALCNFQLNFFCRCSQMQDWPLGDMPNLQKGMIGTGFAATCGNVQDKKAFS